MNVIIQDHCIRCGICIDLCPDLFEMDFVRDEIRVKVEQVPEELVVAAREAVEGCAVGALHLV